MIKKNEDSKKWVRQQPHKQIVCDNTAETESLRISLPVLCDKQETWAQHTPLVAEELWKTAFSALRELSQPCVLFFFLAVPKTKILATGGASHNRDILQVSAGSWFCTGTSSIPVTSQSQTLDNKDCLYSQCCRDGELTACPLPGGQLCCLTVHTVSRFCLIHR